MFGGNGVAPEKHEFELILKGLRPSERSEVSKKWDEVPADWKSMAERLVEENRHLMASRQVICSWFLLHATHDPNCNKRPGYPCSCGFEEVQRHILDETDDGRTVIGTT